MPANRFTLRRCAIERPIRVMLLIVLSRNAWSG